MIGNKIGKKSGKKIENRAWKLLCAAGLIAGSGLLPAPSVLAQAPAPAAAVGEAAMADAAGALPQRLRVGTNNMVPLVFAEAGSDQMPYGYSVELWTTISNALNLTTDWVQYESAPKLLAAVKAGEVDLAIAGLSITAQREANGYDFSQPYFQSGLQLMVPNTRQTLLQVWSQRLFNWNLARPLILVFLSSGIVGSLIWLVERKDNPGFSDRPLPGIGQGMWFAVVTLGTFGYGDVTPMKLGGRLLACTWMGVSFFIVADFIASMTVLQLNEVETSLAQLKGEPIGVVAGTTAEDFLRSQPVEAVPYGDLDSSLAALESGEIAGVVRDYPSLLYWANAKPQAFRLAGELLTSESYGIVFPESDGPLPEAVDRELLTLKEQGYLENLKTKWFSGGPAQ
ncbi:MAG: transporter substrate-binding domain-containing protein [Synechococcales cyanobacterium RM1_1_8]|nr:transporter substrate-binding domain-containing protein [Synechococcales cyanobacterium RM1_1_8]